MTLLFIFSTQYLFLNNSGGDGMEGVRADRGVQASCLPQLAFPVPALFPILIAKYWPFPSISPTSHPFRTLTFYPFLLCLLFFWARPPPVFPHNGGSSSRGRGDCGEGCLKYPRMPSSHALVDFIAELYITCTFNFLLALNFFISSTESWRWILWGTSRFYAKNI